MRKNKWIGAYLSVSILPLFVDASALPKIGFIVYYLFVVANLMNVMRIINNAQKRK
ncbi:MULTISPECIES: hypothetical protein [unclassified Bacteroides]|uniref:hypothetical protein n=1 Tax=unclassified Bacteroides TaxID=2646097 RepID=UPI00259C78A5|nr:hypothetical protein [Bacteroides sp. 41_26]